MAKVKFGDVVKEVKNKIDRNNNPYEFYVAGDHMDTDSLSIPRRGSFLTDDVGPAFIREFKKGQVLYGSRRTYLRKVAVADFDGVTANTTFVLETKDENVLRQRLLPFIMYTEGFTAWSIKKSRGSTNPYVLFKDLADYEFDLPSIKEQDKLAEVLWSINDTLQAYQKLLTQTDALVQAQFVEMFGTPDTNTHGYQIGIISDTVRDVHYGTSKKATDDGDYVYLRMNNITYDGNLDLSDIKRISVPEKELAGCLVKKGDVLFNRTNSRELVGKTCVFDIDEPMIIAGYIIRLRMNGLLCPEYLSTFLNLPSSKKLLFSMAKGAVGQANINAQEIQSIKIIIPPKDIQLQFCGIKARTDRAKSTLQNTITSLQATKRCILENALGTGRKE